MAERTPPPDDAWEVAAGIVRPYLFTQGRTRPALGSLPVEQRRIVAECRAARSVAELAATLNAPLGVVRVLVADLVATGMIDVHAPSNQADDIDLLNRLIARVKAIA
jgi:Protein of unknown function (DUF742)